MKNHQRYELLTRGDLARRWRLSKETIQRRERAGVLRSLKLGRGVRFRMEDVKRIEDAAVGYR
jgi:excisionase family DNA binding protein